MSRRKGERPVVHEPVMWSDSCGIARAIRTGDRWYRAWTVQQCLSADRIVRQTGINRGRLDEFWRDDLPTPQEVAALAGVFRTDATSLQASIDFARRMRGTSERF